MDDSIGIIGSGRLGQALARTAPRADRPVVIANSRGPESLASVVDALGAGITAGTTRDAARCSIVALAGELFDAAGFVPIDIGDLVSGGVLQQAGGPLAGHNLVRLPAPWE
jgi:predicted dinucleotide-binding enzyme